MDIFVCLLNFAKEKDKSTNIIMKKTFFLLLFYVSLTQVMAQEPIMPDNVQQLSFEIRYRYDIIDQGGTIRNNPRTPIQPPTVYLCDHTLYICGDYGNFTLQVLTDDETAVYSTYVPSGTTEVQLPATLSGDYLLQLECGDYLFTGEIEL